MLCLLPPRLPALPPLQPVHLHGSLGREAATGRGTVFAVRELLKAQGLGGIAGKAFVIQVSSAAWLGSWLRADWCVLGPPA